MKAVKLFSTLLIVILTCTVCSCSSSGTLAGAAKTTAETNTGTKNTADGEFTPVIRFMVTSDNHFLADDEAAGGQVMESTHDERLASYDQFRRQFQTAYDYSASQKYKTLDAVLIVGDYTDDGTEKQYKCVFNMLDQYVNKDETELLMVLGNHEFYDTGESGSSKQTSPKTVARFKEYTGHEPNTVNIINGFYFIGVSNDANGGRCLGTTSLKWLATQLKAAADADPTGLKPIFVYTHFPPSQTVYGSIDDASGKSGSYDASGLDRVLKNYPQAVVFTGHYHKPVNDPTAISQKDCTVIASCNMTYGEGQVIDENGNKTLVVISNNKGGYTTSGGSCTYCDNIMGTYILIEVDKDNRVRVQYYDLNTNQFVTDPIIIDSIGRKADFTFTSARKNTSQAPYFESDASISLVDSTSSSLTLQFTQARCDDNVRNYRCELYENGKKVQTIYRMNDLYYYRDTCEIIYAPFSSLKPDTEYTIKIYGVNSYGVWGTQCITGTFRTEKQPEKDGLCQPDILSVSFNADNSAVNTVDGTVLESYKKTVCTTDEKTGTITGVFSGQSAFKWYGIENSYEILKDCVSVSCRFTPVGIPVSSAGLVSNQQQGGVGLEYTKNGKIAFTAYIRGSKAQFETITADNPGTDIIDAVGTYDGNTLKLYINGVLAASKSVSGIIWHPRKSSSQFIVIGGDSALDEKCENIFTGYIYNAEVYSYVLDEAQVKALYTSRN